MNLLKKNYKIIIGVVGGAILLGICILVIFCKKPIKCEFITLSNEYFVVNSTNENVINVPIYVDIKNTEFMKKDNIENVYLTNRTEEELYPVDIEYINYSQEATYDDKTYFQYDMKLNLLFISTEMLKIDNLFLIINYPNDITIKLKLGSITLYNYQNDVNLNYSNLKGLVKIWNNTTMLNGVLIKLTCSSDYTIKNIKTISNFAKVDSLYTKQVYYIDDETTPLDNYIDESFNIIGENTQVDLMDLVEEDHLFIALNYDNYVSTPCVGFIIEYELYGETYEKVVTPFKFYKTNNTNYEINKEVYEANFN